MAAKRISPDFSVSWDNIWVVFSSSVNTDVRPVEVKNTYGRGI